MKSCAPAVWKFLRTRFPGFFIFAVLFPLAVQPHHWRSLVPGFVLALRWLASALEAPAGR